MRHYILYLLAGVLSLGIFFSGCGKQDDNVVWIARDASWYPLNMMGKGDNFLGFTDELIYAIAAEADFHVELVMTSANTLVEGLREKKYTGVISSLVPDSINQQLYAFSETFYPIGPVLVVQKSSTIKNLADLKGKILGVQNDSSFVFMNDPDISITSYENILFGLENLSKGQVDGILMDSIAADVYTSSFYRGKLKIVTPVLTSGGLRLIALKDRSEEDLLSLFNEGLQRIKENGTYEALLEKWGLFNPDIKNEKE